MSNSDAEFDPKSVADFGPGGQAAPTSTRPRTATHGATRFPHRKTDRIPRRNSVPLAALLAACLLGPALAQDAPWSAPLDGICGLGEARAEGCDAIRARAIVDAATPPWSAIGRVNHAGGDLRSHCTGVLVSRRTVLTAGHCLWNPVRKRRIPVESLRFAAGYQRGAALSVSGIARAVLSPAQDPDRPGLGVAPRDDWALLILTEPPAAGIAPLPAFRGRWQQTGPGTAQLAGYAGLTPHVQSLATDCGRPLPAGGALMTGCSAMPGDSGAPLLWQGSDGDGKTGLFVLGIASAVSAATAPYTTRFAPWYRWRDALAAEIAAGN